MILFKKPIEDQEYLLYFGLIVFHIATLQWWQIAPWTVFAILILQLMLFVIPVDRFPDIVKRPLQGLVLILWLSLLWRQSPYLPNHLLFEGLIVVVILITSFFRLLTNDFNPRLRLSHFRIALPILYILAALQKCNTDFFESAYSAHVLESAIVQRFGLDIQLPNLLLASGTVLLELSAGIFLLIPLTRNLGIATALIMHILFALTGDPGVISFSALGVVFLSYYLSDSRIKIMMFWLLSNTVFVIAQSDYTLRMPLLELSLYLSVVAIIWDWRKVKLDPKKLLVRWPQRIIIGLLILNSLSPYIGFKTAGAFNMFSDLKVTKESNNHWWMPQMTVFPYLERQYQVNGISTSCDVVSSSLSTRASSTTTDIQLKRSLFRNCGPDASAEIGDSLKISGRQFLEYSLLERKLVVFE
ncbi:hypothetical protein [Sanyastnella coralliicola]|uniref:hypothetical protein n=1 Tax=Sanyastnella coralliicola TaxID=3069118 RepID=UPI0027B9DFA8|nr:hypothetical protein [Longitalea sp. SCSIO 12813]